MSARTYSTRGSSWPLAAASTSVADRKPDRAYRSCSNGPSRTRGDPAHRQPGRTLLTSAAAPDVHGGESRLVAGRGDLVFWAGRSLALVFLSCEEGVDVATKKQKARAAAAGKDVQAKPKPKKKTSRGK